MEQGWKSRSRAQARRIAALGLASLRERHPFMKQARIFVQAFDGSSVVAQFDSTKPWKGGSVHAEAKRMKRLFPLSEVSVSEPKEGFAEIRIMKKGLRKGTNW